MPQIIYFTLADNCSWLDTHILCAGHLKAKSGVIGS